MNGNTECERAQLKMKSTVVVTTLGRSNWLRLGYWTRSASPLRSKPSRQTHSSAPLRQA